MHKAQVRANKYFWMRYSYKTSKASPYQLNRLNRFIENGWNIANLDYFYILTSDKCIPYCDYISYGEKEMSLTTLKYVVKEITDRDAFPIVVAESPDKLPADLNYYAHAKMVGDISKKYAWEYGSNCIWEIDFNTNEIIIRKKDSSNNGGL